VAQLKSETRRGSAAKARFSLERSCPIKSMAPVLVLTRNFSMKNQIRKIKKAKTEKRGHFY
jgi:hypothetical protein